MELNNQQNPSFMCDPNQKCQSHWGRISSPYHFIARYFLQTGWLRSSRRLYCTIAYTKEATVVNGTRIWMRNKHLQDGLFSSLCHWWWWCWLRWLPLGGDSLSFPTSFSQGAFAAIGNCTRSAGHKEAWLLASTFWVVYSHLMCVKVVELHGNQHCCGHHLTPSHSCPADAGEESRWYCEHVSWWKMQSSNWQPMTKVWVSA